MKRLLIAGGAVAGVAAGVAYLARRKMASGGGPDFARMVERMPDNAPPKWVFNNVNAIRENTERILQVLESRPTGPGAEGE
jgi:hypothetical protein